MRDITTTAAVGFLALTGLAIAIATQAPAAANDQASVAATVDIGTAFAMDRGTLDGLADADHDLSVADLDRTCGVANWIVAYEIAANGLVLPESIEVDCED